MGETTTISSWFESLPHAWERDLREPLLTFELGNDGRLWGFYAMSVLAWSELLVFTVLLAFLMVPVSSLVYFMVAKKQGSFLSYVITYLLVAPMLFLGPFTAFSLLNIHNQVLRFALASIIPVTCLFKTTATAHGFAPKHALISPQAFALYYCCPLLMVRDPKLDKFKTVPHTKALNHLPGLLQSIFASGIILSFFFYLPESVFPRHARGNLPPKEWAEFYSFSKLLYLPGWLPRNLLYAVCYQHMLTAWGGGLVLAQTLATGYETNVIMDNPCFTSTSPSQFWGSKWNLVVHDVLKTGVYLPVRKHFSKYIAMLSSFVASGLFHEALLWLMSYPLDDRRGCLSDPYQIGNSYCYRPRLFTTTIFFVWQAFLLTLEFSFLGRLPVWRQLPTVVAALLTLSVGSPLAHWFVEPYWNSLFFETALPFMFLVKPVDTGFPA